MRLPTMIQGPALRAALPAACMIALTGCGAPDHEPTRSTSGVDLRSRTSVGVLDGDSLRVFGRITDVAVASDGGFAVLDFQARDVRWFDLDGAFQGRIWRRGEARVAGLPFPLRSGTIG